MGLRPTNNNVVGTKIGRSPRLFAIANFHFVSFFLLPLAAAGICEMACMKSKPSKKTIMVGIGLDSDGHKRITTGPNFALAGGVQQTHEEMTEKVIKINEKLASKGKTLEEVSREEFDDIAQSVGLRRP